MHTQPRASIARSNLAHNYELLQKLASPGEVGAVVKANAYGHVAETVSQTLASIGCKTLFTATTDEAVSVRNAIGDKGAIFVFNGGSRREGRSCKSTRNHDSVLLDTVAGFDSIGFAGR